MLKLIWVLDNIKKPNFNKEIMSNKKMNSTKNIENKNSLDASAEAKPKKAKRSFFGFFRLNKKNKDSIKLNSTAKEELKSIAEEEKLEIKADSKNFAKEAKINTEKSVDKGIEELDKKLNALNETKLVNNKDLLIKEAPNNQKTIKIEKKVNAKNSKIPKSRSIGEAFAREKNEKIVTKKVVSRSNKQKKEKFDLKKDIDLLTKQTEASLEIENLNIDK